MTQSQLLITLGKKPIENIVGKGENAGNPQCFQPFHTKTVFFLVTFILSSAEVFNLVQSRILLFGKDLEVFKGDKLMLS